MKNEDIQGIESQVLQEFIKSKTTVSIFLLKGIRLEGVIKGFGKYAIEIFSPQGGTQLIYKHSISTVSEL